MRFDIVHEIETDVPGLWRLFFDREFNRVFLIERQGFEVFRILEQTRDAQGRVHRRVETAIPVEIPAFARRLMGRVPHVIEEGVYDPQTQRYVACLRPDEPLKRIGVHTEFEMWAEPSGPGRIVRTVAVDVEIRAMGVGGLAERIAEQFMRKLYGDVAAFSNEWLAVERGQCEGPLQSSAQPAGPVAHRATGRRALR